MDRQQPIESIHAGNVTCSIWENKVGIGSRSGAMLKATVNVSYKDQKGEWRRSQSFGRNEIPLAIYSLQKAFERMLEKPAGQEISDAIEQQRVV